MLWKCFSFTTFLGSSKLNTSYTISVAVAFSYHLLTVNQLVLGATMELLASWSFPLSFCWRIVDLHRICCLAETKTQSETVIWAFGGKNQFRSLVLKFFCALVHFVCYPRIKFMQKPRQSKTFGNSVQRFDKLHTTCRFIKRFLRWSELV